MLRENLPRANEINAELNKLEKHMKSLEEKKDNGDYIYNELEIIIKNSGGNTIGMRRYFDIEEIRQRTLSMARKEKENLEKELAELK